MHATRRNKGSNLRIKLKLNLEEVANGVDKKIKVKKFLSSLKIIKPSMSLAGVESTVLSPKLTSHSLLSDIERKEQGINDQMIRFSSGIESFRDLKNDLSQAIKKSL